MSKPEVLEKTPMNTAEVKAALVYIREQETELNFRAQKTEEYAQDFGRISVKDAKELYDKIKALDIARLKDSTIHKLIDLMPTNEKHVKIILGTYNLTVTQDNCKKIAEAITEYVPKK